MSTHPHPEAVIVGAVRTPIGAIGGALSAVRADDLAAHVMDAVVRRAGIEKAAVDDVFFGCANQSGEDGRNVARMGLLLAGFPDSVPGITVNRLCASGLDAVILAARAVRAGDGEVFVAGGVENMSRAPLVIDKGATPFQRGNRIAYDTALGWRFPNPRMEAMFPLENMGETAENLVAREGISREEQDAFALRSQEKAVAAIDQGWFREEIVPVEIPKGKGETVVLDTDEGPRRGLTMEKLARLPPAFRKGGTVTAGNSSSLNDGAAALVVCSEAWARGHGIPPMARVVASASAGVDPRYMGIGPVPATRKALARAGLSVRDLDLVELNEAFAGQALAVIRHLEMDVERVNVHGGGVALGHPLGCTGARIVTTLVHAMRRRGGRYGLATLCVGVGQGVSLVIEMLE